MDNPAKIPMIKNPIRKKRKPLITVFVMIFLIVAGTVMALLAVVKTRQHISETKSYSNQYKSADNAVMLHLSAVMDSTSSAGLSYVTENRSAVLKEIEQSREAVDYFVGINPPSSLNSAIALVRKAADSERAYLDAAEKVFRAETVSQLEEGISAVGQSGIVKISSNGFSKAVAGFMEQLEQLTSIKNRDEDDHVFIWL